MKDESKIALDCPYCQEPIYRSLDWFKKRYATCPACERGLSADQFAAVVSELEQAMDAEIDAMLQEPKPKGCCGGGSSPCC